ncbi:MAG: UDP-N-acetylglucosamine--N-acetylmuramyl-(pentapeptide) pyrophosphoryl-undecaprenol N-acetylglucosamine transferase, partial [Flavobacteriaceae bacterium]
HQVKNAQALVDQGAAIMIQEPQLDRDFKTHFMRLLEDAQMRASLSKAIKGMAREGATREIVDEIQKLTP